MSTLTEADRLSTAKRLAAVDHDRVIGVREAVVPFNTTVALIQQACSTVRIAKGGFNLSLPRGIEGVGRRVAWFHGEARDALAMSQAQGPAQALSTEAASNLAAEAASAKAESAPSAPGVPKTARMGHKRKV